MNQSRTNRFWRSAAQFLFGGIALALLTLICFRFHVNPTTVALLYLIVIVLVSLTGGCRLGIGGWGLERAAVRRTSL
jgi:hypothetical protein